MSDVLFNEKTEIEQSNEPDVVKSIVKEIRRMGDNQKQNFESLNSSYHALKGTLEDISADKSKTEKLIEDITIRQAALDKKNIEQEILMKRFDELELAFQRHGKAGLNKEKSESQIENFKAAILAINKGGATIDALKDYKLDEKDFDAYKDVFVSFLRKKGDQRSLTPEQYKTLSVGVDPDGGYTVIPAMSNKIIERLFEMDPVRQLANVENITTDALEWLVDYGEFGYGWETETAAGDETVTGDLKKKRIPVHIMYAKPRATQQLLEDSAMNIEQWLSKRTSEKFTRAEGTAFVNGDGIGKPRGFLTYASGTSWGQIQQVAMGAAAALTADGFYDVKFSLKEQYLERGTWLMNRQTVRDSLKLKDGTGNYLWSPAFDTNRYSTILNLPVRMATTMPIVAANALSVALADWKEAYYIVDRLGITVQRDPYTVKPFVEFYFRKRVGGDVVQYEAIKLGIIST
jgi:HK97 family phage major capsid protein